MTRVIVLCVSIIVSAGCSHGRVAGREVHLTKAWRAFEQHCDLSGSAVICDRQHFVDALDAVVDNWQVAVEAQIDLKKCQDMSGVDAAEARGKIDECTDRLGEAKSQRWVFGAGGLGVGLLLLLVLI